MKPSFYQVQKGIPIPPQGSGRPRGPILIAMAQLKVGDSFLVPINTSDNRIHSAMKRLGIKISTRKLEDGRRIWRTK